MRIVHTAIKMTLVSVIASLIARVLGLDYWITCGLLALLSIQLTKRDSLVLTGKRMVDALFALGLSTLMFVAFGYQFWVFSVFVLIFVYVSLMFKIAEGIVPALVLVTHLLIEGVFSMPALLNTVFLMAIALAVALPFNLFYPTASEREIKRYIASIDQLLKDHLFMFALLLKDHIDTADYELHHAIINDRMHVILKEARLVDKDILFANDHRYLSYLEMRKTQLNYINHMYQHALRIESRHPFMNDIADYVKALSYDIGLYDKATKQLENLTRMRDAYKSSELPKSRDEFETRAMLYQIVNEIEHLLHVKIHFHKQYPDFQQSPAS
ncbi:MAG: aromatic acid exporter family protein [Acholeplasmataceae bacterium]|nr:MAG: aromatic acid exporter family protein [Acholeplasmataceae bacterium]